ncbi:hypothetical protein EC968_005742 [Mortierella alpina]|nr:hypothetical protein EC968_005742 [Mortierella alpina]
MAHPSNNDPSYDANLLQYLLDQDMIPFNKYSDTPALPSSSAVAAPAPTTASHEASQPRTKKTASVLSSLLPSTPYSHKQASSRTRTVMPIQPKVTASVAASTATASAITGTPSVTLGAPTVTASASTAAPPLDVWVQQFQQLQQMHYQQQHQLLSSTLFSNLMHESSKSSSTAAGRHSSAHRGSSSDRSNSPSSSSDKGDPNPIYPSPSIKDNMHMDSDSEDVEIHGSDPLKPTESELKNMTSKERRQLRNKLSARNFRVRRKEYIGTLENQVKEARREAADLQRRLIQSELNCQFLRQELETARFSQSLFTSGHMSKDQANLLASLLHPHTESFPSAGTASNTAAAPNIGASLQQPAPWTNTAALPTGNTSQSNSDVQAPPALSNSVLATDLSQPSLQPYVPFDGDWNLFINRVEVPEAMVDPKQAPSKDDINKNELLAHYEAARLENELDEQMRCELKAHTERKLAQTYLVMPKDQLSATSSKNVIQDELVLQTVVYMLMIQMTHSLFEAATLSKLDMVKMFRTMDGSLRTKMVEEDRERQQVLLCEGPCKFYEWRESWIRKRWPSLFNNRVRLSELSRMSGEATTGKGEEMDEVETARKMEEGVAGKTVEVPRVNFFVRYCLPTWAKCPEILERERLEDEARARREHKAHLESSSKALQALLKVSA